MKESRPGERLLGAAVLLALPMAALVATAGEPIRFIRPKADEKAPLRMSYSAEAAQAKEKTSMNLPPGAGGSGARISPTIIVNRRASGRRSWSTESEDPKPAPKVEPLRWRATDEEDSRRSTPEFGAGGLFGLGGGAAPSTPGGISYGADNANPTRAPSDFGLRGLGDSDPNRSVFRGNTFNPWGWSTPSTAPAGSSFRPQTPGPEVDSRPIESPAFTPVTPAPSRSDSLSPRPLHSFDLPGRPR